MNRGEPAVQFLAFEQLFSAGLETVLAFAPLWEHSLGLVETTSAFGADEHSLFWLEHSDFLVATGAAFALPSAQHSVVAPSQQPDFFEETTCALAAVSGQSPFLVETTFAFVEEHSLFWLEHSDCVATVLAFVALHSPCFGAETTCAFVEEHSLFWLEHSDCVETVLAFVALHSLCFGLETTCALAAVSGQSPFLVETTFA
ncbi:MAG: hypothetical protein GY711_11040, partial [bacterium]|nr:hypothetical protein [bacterium]